MDFMRARTPEQITSRQDEIINACNTLFCQKGYEGVTFKAISEITSFARPTLYNYYKTKDEILLDLLARELLSWQNSLLEVMNNTSVMKKEQYSEFLTQTLLSHEKMLKLLSILYTVLEINSSVEKLAEFKKISHALDTIYASVDQYFPEATQEHKITFVSTFSMLILGLYPLSHQSDKQLEAMKLAGISYPPPDIKRLCYQGILLLLSDL